MLMSSLTIATRNILSISFMSCVYVYVCALIPSKLLRNCKQILRGPPPPGGGKGIPYESALSVKSTIFSTANVVQMSTLDLGE